MGLLRSKKKRLEFLFYNKIKLLEECSWSDPFYILNLIIWRNTILKAVLRLLLALLLMLCLSACANSNIILKGICQGIYNASNQAAEMREPENKPSRLKR